MSADLCGCGCGEPVKPGNRYVHNHHPGPPRLSGSHASRTAWCPECGRRVELRADGSPGAHWTSGVADVRLRCTGGASDPGPDQRPGQRVTVTVDVVLPSGWDVARFENAAAGLLRAHLDEPFVVGVEVSERAAP